MSFFILHLHKAKNTCNISCFLIWLMINKLTWASVGRMVLFSFLFYGSNSAWTGSPIKPFFFFFFGVKGCKCHIYVTGERVKCLLKKAKKTPRAEASSVWMVTSDMCFHALKAWTKCMGQESGWRRLREKGFPAWATGDQVADRVSCWKPHVQVIPCWR